MAPQQRTIRRELVLWLGSFLMVAILFLAYFGAPWWPIVLAGGGTFAVTLIRYVRASREVP